MQSSFKRIIALCFAASIVACGSNTQQVSPTVQRITESVYASGVVKSINQYNVYSTVIGRIDSIFVPEVDKVNSQIVLDTFTELNRKFQQTLLVVTHDLEFADQTQRIIKMEDGQVLRQLSE